MNRQKQPTLFLDRDGTINVNLDDTYVTKPSELELIPGVAAALVRARNAGYKLAIITNQAGIGKGLYSDQDLNEIHNEMTALIRKETGDSTFEFDCIEFCPHKSDVDCACRKPKTLMMERAIATLDSDLLKSFYIGDKKADLYCGADAGVRAILVRTGYGKKTEKECAEWTDKKPVHIANDLSDAVDFILSASA